MQGEDAQGTVALMEAKIRRLQGIITRNQPQEELNLRHHSQPGAGAAQLMPCKEA